MRNGFNEDYSGSNDEKEEGETYSTEEGDHCFCLRILIRPDDDIETWPVHHSIFDIIDCLST
jgi:hypothetical protein